MRISIISFAVLCLALTACPEKSPLVDEAPLSADEQLFQDGLALYDAADFAGAQLAFDALRADFADSNRHDNAGYLAGRCRYEQALYADAIPVLLEMRALHPDSTFVSSAAYFAGRSRYQLGDYVAAVADFASAAIDPAATYADNAQYYVGRANYEAGLLDVAVDAFAALEAVFPSSSYLDNGRYYLGRSFFDRDLFDEAIPPLERVSLTAASIFADNAQFYIGRSDYGAGRLDDALGGFVAVVASFPNSQYVDNALRYQLQVHVDQGDCAAAQTALDALQIQFPTSAELTRAQNYASGNGC